MMARSAFILSFCLLLAFPLPALSWWAEGHMTVAEIAFRGLKPGVKTTVLKLVDALADDYPTSNDFMSAACWPDDIKADGMSMFDEWHYIDQAFSPDGTNPNKDPEDRNIVWALGQMQQTLQRHRAILFEQSQVLRFLTHFVGDIHQPLHCASLFTNEFPNGDRGGNSFTLPISERNLHGLWDAGLGMFNFHPKRPLGDDNVAYIRHLADTIMNEHPSRDFDVSSVDFAKWALDGYSIARNVVYRDIEKDKTPSDVYMKIGTSVARQQIALAGYRLGALLNELLSDDRMDAVLPDAQLLRLRGSH
mmetsp:Transcript_36056/g.60037  ORF Transcript_36056/g.60037 Transcript_36056/m.60037 type:complete len:305 (+) Transcript_36056:82-996(+)